MTASNNFVLDYDTILFLPRFTTTGKLCTTVMKMDGAFDEELGPTALIDFNLRYYGSSLRGARDGAKMILGNGYMHPVIINERLGLYWFPSKSPFQSDCIWFALHQIKDSVAVGTNKTKIFFHNGSTITIDISRAVFDNKVHKTYKLKARMESRTDGILMQVSESKACYHIAPNEGNVNFHVLMEMRE